MKIEDIRIAVFKNTPGDNPVTPRIPRFYRKDEVYSAIVRVITDTGIEGYGGFGMWSRADKGFSKHTVLGWCSQVLGRIKPEMVGRDVHDREWLWDQRHLYGWWGGMSGRSASAVDVALWDIAGKEAGEPVYKLLGAARHKIKAYASGPYYPQPEQHAELAARCRELGYRAFKIKPGGEPLKQVMKTADLVRDAAGPDMDLMLDAQLCYSYTDALKLGKHLQELDFTWLEDPVRHDDLDAWGRLSQKLDIPIAYTDHTSVCFRELAEMIRRNPWLRIVRSDTAKDGVTGLKKLCSLAEGFGVNCEIHMAGLEQLHVALSVNNCDYFEDSALSWLMKDGLTGKPEGAMAIDAEGYVCAPEVVGIGKSYDFDKMDVVEELT